MRPATHTTGAPRRSTRMNPTATDSAATADDVRGVGRPGQCDCSAFTASGNHT